MGVVGNLGGVDFIGAAGVVYMSKELKRKVEFICNSLAVGSLHLFYLFRTFL